MTDISAAAMTRNQAKSANLSELRQICIVYVLPKHFSSSLYKLAKLLSYTS